MSAFLASGNATADSVSLHSETYSLLKVGFPGSMVKCPTFEFSLGHDLGVVG